MTAKDTCTKALERHFGALCAQRPPKLMACWIMLNHVRDLAGKHVLLAASFLPCVCVQECFKYMLSGTLGEIVSFERATRGVAMF